MRHGPGGDAPPGAPALPDVLRDPATFDGATTPEVVETHVSWIALAGPYAYKLKKPVRYEFLDYSSREQRLAACRTELALNRRWAPQLYLDLCWLVATAERTARCVPDATARASDAVEPPGEPAVRMRRFDRDQELDRLIARDDVRHEELHRLGADLAGWEAAAPVAAPDTPWGSPDGALSAVLESFGALREPAAPFAHARLAQLESQLRDAHRRLERWFETRRATGRIRECHGDLHCRNVVRIDGRLTPFDAIDFSASLRWIDVASDAAFLAMDLLQFGRPDLAYAFLDGWFDASGDHDAARGLPWYLAYRALVRAKVDGLRARQLGPGADADAAWREADRFLALAEARLRPAPGRLYVTTGPSGSGKSWLAERLVPVLPAIRLRSDVERKRLAGLAPLDRRGAGLGSALYAPEASARTYDALANAARELLAAGFDVLVDAANLQAAQRDLFRRVAREAGTTLAWLDCTAAPATLRARLDARQGDASDATTAVLEMQLATREPLDEREVAAAVRVDTGVRVDAAAVTRALRAAAAPPDGSTPASAPAS